MKQQRLQIHAALTCVAFFRFLLEDKLDCEHSMRMPNENLQFADKKSKGYKHRTQCCVGAKRFRSVTCGRRSNSLKISSACA